MQGHLMGPSTLLSRLGAGKESSVPGRCPLPVPRGGAGSRVSWVQARGSEGCGVLRGAQCRCGLGACGLPSFSLAQQNFGDEGDNGTCRLIWVKLCKEVTHILPGASRLLGHETKDPGGTKAGWGGLSIPSTGTTTPGLGRKEVPRCHASATPVPCHAMPCQGGATALPGRLTWRWSRPGWSICRRRRTVKGCTRGIATNGRAGLGTVGRKGWEGEGHLRS